MLKSRIIPCLLISGGGLVKTIGFSNKIYLGDPINAVKIFSEKEVDELIILDIDATAKLLDLKYDDKCFIKKDGILMETSTVKV